MPDANRLAAKERMKIPRVPMPELDAAVRAHNFEEVNRGLSATAAVTEATRCIACPKPTCQTECPVGVKIKEVVALINAGDFLAAAAKMREDNALPAITGRVCPQESQCEGGCVVGKKGAPIAVGNLERFIADFERESGQLGLPTIAPFTGKSVAIVGSGPAGLSAAGDLIQRGHRVRVFEALHELGGVLVYGIPEFRLPKSIVRQEIDNLRRILYGFTARQLDSNCGVILNQDAFNLRPESNLSAQALDFFLNQANERLRAANAVTCVAGAHPRQRKDQGDRRQLTQVPLSKEASQQRIGEAAPIFHAAHL
jgi:hypothetical protein